MPAPVLIRLQGHGLQQLPKLCMQALQDIVHHKPQTDESPGKRNTKQALGWDHISLVSQYALRAPPSGYHAPLQWWCPSLQGQGVQGVLLRLPCCATAGRLLFALASARCAPAPPTCKDAGFCRRNRGVSGKAYRVEPSSVQAAGPSVSGILVNDKAPEGSKSFAWSLVAHAGGFARLQVDESPSVGRYRINDILEADAQAAKADWTQLGGDAKGSSFASGRLSVAITYEPFRMAFSIDGKPAVNLNSRDMFQFEHRRSKE
eukprot:scaffold69943_cov20-Tisochrysis_lutea.AAC.3